MEPKEKEEAVQQQYLTFFLSVRSMRPTFKG